jgi:small subunit ribosomal protein S1
MSGQPSTSENTSLPQENHEPQRLETSASSHPTGGSDAASQSSREPTAGPGADTSSETSVPVAQETQPPVHKGPEFVSAEVKRVTIDALLVALSGDGEGRLSLSEYAGLPVPTVGETIHVRVDREENGTLSITRVSEAENTFWDSVKEGDTLEGVVTGMNKGGLDIDIGGARAFLPASHVDIKPVKDISMLIGEHVTCIVSQVDRTSRDLVVSRRKFLRKAVKQKRHELFEGLEEGQTRTGKVASVTDYGAFVDLGGANGLLHMSDMTWGRIRHPSEMVHPEQELEVKILKVDPKKGKISLGLKQLQPDPWESIQERYPKDSKVTGRVISLTDFGAFLELEPGVEALLPLSEMSWSRHAARPSDMVSEGQEIEVVVLKVDPARRKFSVGTRQLQENPWASVETRFPINDTFKGKVTRTMEFGAFVEVAEGVEGLIHISELADRRVRAVTDVVKEGDEVEVRVIKVDPKAQRLSLSMKPLTKQDIEDARPRKKKKRPERGGLSSHIDSDTRNKTGLTLGM